MRHFHRIATGIDTTGLVHTLTLSANLWNQHRLRQVYPGSPHAEADDIWLRFQAEGSDVVDEHECVEFEAWWRLPEARHMVHTLMRQVEGTRLGRVVVTRLKPGGRIHPHADGGSPATYYERYQIALQARPGVAFRAGDEAIEQRTGDIWWFDNTQVHEVVNNSDDDRIVLIVDIRCVR
jgi:quercetin dioxygenase-like cupin family protein